VEVVPCHRHLERFSPIFIYLSRTLFLFLISATSLLWRKRNFLLDVEPTPTRASFLGCFLPGENFFREGRLNPLGRTSASVLTFVLLAKVFLFSWRVKPLLFAEEFSPQATSPAKAVLFSSSSLLRRLRPFFFPESGKVPLQKRNRLVYCLSFGKSPFP